MIDLILLLSESGESEKSYFGGEDDILALCREGSYFHDSKIVPKGCCASTIQAIEASHEFDYDLVVIGGKFISATSRIAVNAAFYRPSRRALHFQDATT